MKKTVKKQEEKLYIAISEAERFIEKARTALKSLKKEEVYYRNKEYASAKRSSMDLGNALVDIRRG